MLWYYKKWSFHRNKKNGTKIEWFQKSRKIARIWKIWKISPNTNKTKNLENLLNTPKIEDFKRAVHAARNEWFWEGCQNECKINDFDKFIRMTSNSKFLRYQVKRGINQKFSRIPAKLRQNLLLWKSHPKWKIQNNFLDESSTIHFLITRIIPSKSEIWKKPQSHFNFEDVENLQIQSQIGGVKHLSKNNCQTEYFLKSHQKPQDQSI